MTDTQSHLPSLAPSPRLSAKSSPEPSRPLAPAPPPPPSGGRGDDTILGGIMRFFATATPAALTAVGVALVLATYLIIGQIGLVLVGAFGGIAVFVSYEAADPAMSRAVRRERGVDALQRLWVDMRNDALVRGKGEGEGEGPAADEDGRFRDFDQFEPETRDALAGLVDAVIRDYVKWWYSPIVPTDLSFPLACRSTLTSFLLAMSTHLGRKRPADCFLDFLTNSSSIVIVFLSELSSAFSGLPAENGGGSPTAAAAVFGYLAENPDSNLANLLNQKHQASKFRMVAEDLLRFLDRPAYNCVPVRAFLREIMAVAVLETTLKTCSRPEWINGWIVYLLEAGEPDLSQAIDVGMQAGAGAGAVAAAKPDTSADVDGNLGGDVSIARAHAKTNQDGAPHGGSGGEDEGGPAPPLPHRKHLSRAEADMEAAMRRMQEMNELIAREQEAGRARHQQQQQQQHQVGQAVDENSTDTGARPHRAGSATSPTSPTSPTSAPAEPAAESRPTSERTVPEGSRTSYPAAEPPHQQESPPTRVNGGGGGVVDDNNNNSNSNSNNSNSGISNNNSSSSRYDNTHRRFTSFDQIIPPTQAEVESARVPTPMTLHDAAVTIHEDATDDKGKIRSKPNWDYLIQIEPASGLYPGWMIVRRYGDFETLHEVLRRIANISGATSFAEQHGSLPGWKGCTRETLRGGLERYLRDACWHGPLADSEGLRRFLERDHPVGAAAGGAAAAASSRGLRWENVGKGMLDVLTIAPKGAVEGGRAVVGGVTGVLGNMGLGGKRQQQPQPQQHLVGGSTNSSSMPDLRPAGVLLGQSQVQGQGQSQSHGPGRFTFPASVATSTVPTPQRADSIHSTRRAAAADGGRDSLDSQRSSITSTQSDRVEPIERCPSQDERIEPGGGGHDGWDRLPQTSGASASVRSSRDTGRILTMAGSRSSTPPLLPSPWATTSGGDGSKDWFKLPPPPDEMPDDYGGGSGGSWNSPMSPERLRAAAATTAAPTIATPASSAVVAATKAASAIATSAPPATVAATTAPVPVTATPAKKSRPQKPPLSESETRVAVELLFAVINELYTLSSAWNIRLTLLGAAKTFLLRPGNPSLGSIRELMQRSVLDDNLSDSGMAAHLRRLRESSLGGDDDTAAAAAVPPLSPEEQDRLRVKARALLIRSGMPAALTGVMGQSATGEALGRVFDCLQIEEVARGLMFGLILQAVRAITH